MENKKEKKKSSLGMGCLGFIILVIIVYFIMFSGDNGEDEEETSYISLNASVKFTETHFIIENNDNFDWLNVKMDINGGFLKRGFILDINTIEAGESYTIGASQFAKRDGTRFNPFIYKPQKFDISCNTPEGKNAFWHGSWEDNI